jgi:hypothetical protein
MRLRIAVIAALAILASMGGILAAPAKDELTFSASLVNPNNGTTVWSGTGEYLIGVAGTLLVGPSVTLFDLGPVQGGSVGVTGEFGVGKTSGLFVGAALKKLTGDAADAADYTGEARAGIKFGGERGFAKLYLSQVWSQAGSGEISKPDGTSFVAGLGLRF